MADGRLNKCKDCVKMRIRKYRLKNIDGIRKYDRERGKLPHRIMACCNYNKRYKVAYPARYIAVTVAGNAVRGGKLKKKTRCEMCGRKTRLIKHHKDYSKPLDVIWVCQVCHKKLHGQI